MQRSSWRSLPCGGRVCPRWRGTAQGGHARTGPGLGGKRQRVTNRSRSTQSDPDGSNPKGQGGFADMPDFKFKGQVVCLRVSGNRASVVVRAEHTKNQPPTLGGDVMFLEDNGKGPGNTSPDFITNARLTQAQTDAFAANGCPPPIHIRRRRSPRRHQDSRRAVGSLAEGCETALVVSHPLAISPGLSSGRRISSCDHGPAQADRQAVGL